jgi:hypothetical protein
VPERSVIIGIVSLARNFEEMAMYLRAEIELKRRDDPAKSA